jgi:hypothetical protein
VLTTPKPAQALRHIKTEDMPNHRMEPYLGHEEVHARRSAVEMAIEKYEKTAMQWLQEKTQTN